MPIDAISHIGICVSDLERSLTFYCDRLGFREVADLEIAGAQAERLLQLSNVKLKAVYLERDGTRIELLSFDQPGTVDDDEGRRLNRLGLTHLSFAVHDLDALVTELEREGVRVLHETRIGDAAVMVTDPDGTRIELYHSDRVPKS